MQLEHIPVIDAHCHLIFPTYQEHDLAAVLSLSLEEMPREQLRESLIYKKVLGELAEAWWGDPQRQGEVPEERHRRMTEDYQGYVRSLLQEVSIEGMVVDLGYKPAWVPLEEFEGVVSADVLYFFRIESVLDELWKEGGPFIQADDTFRDAIDQALEGNHVGLKTIIGYRTGLDIRRVSRDEARASWGYEEKAARDYFLGVAVEKCRQYSCPLQIHTSFGESNIDLRGNNPLHLKAFLEWKNTRHIPVVLVHGGYPYSFEAGYMCGMYPNVYMDISEGIPWVALETDNILRKVLSMAPLNKVFFGSDGFIVPEIAWIAAKMMKASLGRIISEMIEAKFLPMAKGEEVAADILGRNARGLFW